MKEQLFLPNVCSRVKFLCGCSCRQIRNYMVSSTTEIPSLFWHLDEPPYRCQNNKFGTQRSFRTLGAHSSIVRVCITDIGVKQTSHERSRYHLQQLVNLEFDEVFDLAAQAFQFQDIGNGPHDQNILNVCRTTSQQNSMHSGPIQRLRV